MMNHWRQEKLIVLQPIAVNKLCVRRNISGTMNRVYPKHQILLIK